MNIKIQDGPGKMAVADMRPLFERSIEDTPLLSKTFKLGFAANKSSMEFVHYLSPETDAAWVGFALGMRCAERLVRAGYMHLE